MVEFIFTFIAEIFLDGVLGLTGSVCIKIFTKKQQSIATILEENQKKAQWIGFLVWVTIISAWLSLKFIYF